jgi:hypothetical protein
MSRTLQSPSNIERPRLAVPESATHLDPRLRSASAEAPPPAPPTSCPLLLEPASEMLDAGGCAVLPTPPFPLLLATGGIVSSPPFPADALPGARGSTASKPGALPRIMPPSVRSAVCGDASTSVSVHGSSGSMLLPGIPSLITMISGGWLPRQAALVANDSNNTSARTDASCLVAVLDVLGLVMQPPAPVGGIDTLESSRVVARRTAAASWGCRSDPGLAATRFDTSPRSWRCPASGRRLPALGPWGAPASIVKAKLR